jgi:hypothetical protein
MGRESPPFESGYPEDPVNIDSVNGAGSGGSGGGSDGGDD